MNLSSRYVSCLCVALLLVACESEQKREPMPPGPAVVEQHDQVVSAPAGRDEEAFLKGTPAQRDMLVAMRTMMLSDADDHTMAVKVLTDLFYSEPESLVQLGAGAELADLLWDLEQREAAENVLDELETASIDPSYGVLLWLRAARLRAEMGQDARALALYERVLTHQPSYGFLHGEIAALEGADPAAQERYEVWRKVKLEAAQTASFRQQALEPLLMARHDPEIARVFRELLVDPATLDPQMRSRITMWIEKHRAESEEKEESGQGGEDAPQ